jgi:hypothetical protein
MNYPTHHRQIRQCSAGCAARQGSQSRVIEDSLNPHGQPCPGLN